MLTLDIFYDLYTKIGDCRFSRSRDMIEIENGSSRDPGNASFRDALLIESSDLI